MAGDFDISRYKDRYRQQLMGVIRKKARGQRIEVPDAPKTEAAPDLMEALRASLDGTGGSRGKGGGSKKAPTLEELRRRAAKAGIEGRSKMGRAELERALAAA
jgi:DNA end-binding protein Ku